MVILKRAFILKNLTKHNRIIGMKYVETGSNVPVNNGMMEVYLFYLYRFLL